MAETRTSRGRWRRRVLGAALTVVLLAAALLGSAYALWRAEPAYWRVVEAEAAVATEDARRFERATLSTLTRVRPETTRWRVRVDQERINRWLAARLPQWLENQDLSDAAREALADHIQHPMVAFEEGGLVLAAELTVRGRTQIVSLRFVPSEGTANETVRLRLDGIYSGRLPVPRAVAENLLRDALDRLSPDQRERAGRLLGRVDAVPLEVPLDDGRSVRVLDVTLRKGVAELECRTVRGEGESKGEGRGGRRK